MVKQAMKAVGEVDREYNTASPILCTRVFVNLSAFTHTRAGQPYPCGSFDLVHPWVSAVKGLAFYVSVLVC